MSKLSAQLLHKQPLQGPGVSTSAVQFTLGKLDSRKTLVQVLKVDSRPCGWTILGSSVPRTWSRGKGMDASPGVECGQSRKEPFTQILGWYCSPIPGALRDSTKHLSRCSKNEVQSDLSWFMISKHGCVILSEAGIVFIFFFSFYSCTCGISKFSG